MARHRNGNEERQAEEQVRPRENVVNKARAPFELQPMQLHEIERESQRQDDDDHTYQPVGAKAPTCDKTSKQGGCEGGCEVSACDSDGLSDQHTNVCHEQHQQCGERKASLKTLLDTLVGRAEFCVVFSRWLEHKYLPQLRSDPEDSTELNQRDHDEVKERWTVELASIETR